MRTDERALVLLIATRVDVVKVAIGTNYSLIERHRPRCRNQQTSCEPLVEPVRASDYGGQQQQLRNGTVATTRLDHREQELERDPASWVSDHLSLVHNKHANLLDQVRHCQR